MSYPINKENFYAQSPSINRHGSDKYTIKYFCYKLKSLAISVIPCSGQRCVKSVDVKMMVMKRERTNKTKNKQKQNHSLPFLARAKWQKISLLLFHFSVSLITKKQTKTLWLFQLSHNDKKNHFLFLITPLLFQLFHDDNPVMTTQKKTLLLLQLSHDDKKNHSLAISVVPTTKITLAISVVPWWQKKSLCCYFSCPMMTKKITLLLFQLSHDDQKKSLCCYFSYPIMTNFIHAVSTAFLNNKRKTT